MVDLNAISAILSVRNVLVVIASLLALVVFRMWAGLPAVMGALLERRKAQWAREDSKYDHLFAEVQHFRGEVAALRDLHHKCEEELRSIRDDLAVEKAERMKLDRLLSAEGEIRQSQATAQAEIRADPDKATTTVKRFNGDKGEGK